MGKIEQGQIYILGDHILGVGSSTDQEFVDKVLRATGSKIKAVITDPPYGVAYVEGKKGIATLASEKGAGGRVIANDHEQTEEEYEVFTEAWIRPILPHLDKYNTFHIFNSDLMFRALRNGMEKAGLYYSQMLIWVKNQVVIGRKDYLPMHELIAYGWYGRHKMVRGKQKSVIFHPKPTRAALHPTMKPPGLLRKILPNATEAHQWVYDPFGGSGSTLIASEHLKRRCVIIELDTLYCETIIARWKELTKHQPKLYTGD